MTKQILAVSLIVAIIFLSIGYLIGAKNFLFPIASGPNTFQAGWDAAKARLADSGFASPIRANMEIKNISGEVQGISGNKITLKIRPLEPLADVSLDTRVVIADSATKIYELEQKSTKEYTAELDAYNKSRKAAGPMAGPIALPEIFNKLEISISDLKVGDIIGVIAEKDIKEVKEFAALEINLNKLVAPMVAPAPSPVKQ